MKVLISDYLDVLNRQLEYEKDIITTGLRGKYDEDIKIEIYAYEGSEEFLEHIKDADVLLTAFLPIDEHVIKAAKMLKCISVNATGYGTIDVEAAKKRNIAVVSIKEYCTNEVAEHTMALILGLSRNIKHYTKEIEEKHIWSYQSAEDTMERIAGKTLAIFGLGKIGQAVAKRAKAFEMNVIAVDPYLPKYIADEIGVSLVGKEEAFEKADIISNHMNQTNENKLFFSMEEFKLMKKHPMFVNVGRGECVDETALLSALQSGKIRGAALDVLQEENPVLLNHPLVGLENVILTPHAAFYSKESMRDLQKISCENIVEYMNSLFE